jgi:hypothetical protein
MMGRKRPINFFKPAPKGATTLKASGVKTQGLFYWGGFFSSKALKTPYKTPFRRR